MAIKFTCDQVKDYLEEIKYAKCVFIIGDDTFQKDTCTSEILKALKISFLNDINNSLFFGDDFEKDSEIKTILINLNTYPFEEIIKNTIIKKFEKMHKEGIKKIADYIENPAVFSRLIISTTETNEIKDLIKIFERNAVVIHTLTFLQPKHLENWTLSYIENNYIKIEKSAISYLLSKVKQDTYTIHNELQKLELYTNGALITSKDVNDVILYSKKYDLYDLSNAIGNKNKKLALMISDSIYQTEYIKDDNCMSLIGHLTTFFLSLLKIHALILDNISVEEIINKHLENIKMKYRQNNIGFAKNYKLQEIRNVFNYLYLFEYRAKTGFASINKVQLTEVILKIIG
jgi:DNA polymerase-3 subunit delta